jgi:hypothetical protein
MISAKRALSALHTFVVLALLVVHSACCSSPMYQGDGTVERNFRGAKIDLGPINLTKPGRYQFRMTHLSSCEMVVGFRTADRQLDASVRVTLLNNRDETVVDETAPLQAWVWQEPEFFVYRRGESRDVPIPGSTSVHVEPVGVRADHGWGTYFVPTAGEYRLAVEVLEPTHAPSGNVRTAVECVDSYSL